MKRRYFGKARAPLTPAVRAGEFVYVSGQVPVDTNGSVVPGGIEEQTRQVLENVCTVLAMAGCTMEDIVKTGVILADSRDFSAFNRIYASYFQKNPPARTTVEAGLMIDVKIEIEAIAYKPN